MAMPPTDGPAAAPPPPRPGLRAVAGAPRPAAAKAAPVSAPDASAAGVAPEGTPEEAAEAPARRPARPPRGRARALPGADPAPEPAAPAPDGAPAPGDAAAAGVAAQPARLRPRHWTAAAAFLLLVVLPFAAAVVYLETRAADRFHSDVAFSIRSEEAASAAAGLIGAITSIGTGTASDADILYEYVRSQGVVEAVDAELDLRAIWGRARERDPVFAIAPDAPIEALVGHWGRMVDVAFETGAGIIQVRVQAFTPEDARAIAQAVLERSSALVNQLSEQAREDAVRFAREELAEAEAHLAAMRARLSAFRRENRIVDPSADVAGQMGLLNALQAELAQALVERDVLLSFVGEEDQRVIQANRRIDAITGRIEAERASLGVTGSAAALPEVVGRYEELLVDLEFANTAYTQALASLAAARAEARRQSRYLAPHVRPTLAESPLYPRRLLLAGLVGLFLLLGWGALTLVYYNLRDTR
jgi:capsular polysaccharide transport system permease protein